MRKVHAALKNSRRSSCFPTVLEEYVIAHMCDMVRLRAPVAIGMPKGAMNKMAVSDPALELDELLAFAAMAR